MLKRIALALSLAIVTTSTYAQTVDAGNVAAQVRVDESEKHRLLVTGETYAMVVNCTDAVIEKFTAGEQELIGDVPLCPTLHTGKVNGPAKVHIDVGPVVTVIRLTNLWWTDLKGGIEIDLYCYPDRVFAVAEVRPEGTAPDLFLGWYGGAKFSMPLVMYSEEELQRQASFNGQDPNCAAVVAEPWIQFGRRDEKLRSMINFRNSIGRISGGYLYRSSYVGPRRASIILIGCRTNAELKETIRGLGAMPFASVSVDGGKYVRFDGSTGYFAIERRGNDAREMTIETAFVRPGPPPPPPPPSLLQRISMALAKISWPVGIGLFALLAVAVFGFGARPQSGTIAARMRPMMLATGSAFALVVAALWLFRPPPPPGPSEMPMPQQSMTAVFRIANAPENSLLTAAEGATIKEQAVMQPDGATDSLVAIALAPTGTTAFSLRTTTQH